MNPYLNNISKATSFNTVKLGLSLGVACILGLSSANANSEDASAIQVSASQVNGAVSQARLLDAPASDNNETQVAALHQQATLLTATADNSSKVTREQRMAVHQKAAATQENQQLRALAQQNQVIYYDFSFYDAQTRLFEDYDYDGFYQTFSVTFDADINSSGGDVQADVFAELYLSQNGGPGSIITRLTYSRSTLTQALMIMKY
nr:choice-of-anchor H family protein [Shewanella sp. KJ10-1]